jgi:hypothetical protein
MISGRTALNLLLKRHPFPIPKIGDMIRSMEGFTFASALDLNMGYYHIKLDADYSFSKDMYHCIFIADEKIQIQTLTHGYQDCPRCFSKRHV